MNHRVNDRILDLELTAIRGRPVHPRVVEVSPRYGWMIVTIDNDPSYPHTFYDFERGTSWSGLNS